MIPLSRIERDVMREYSWEDGQVRTGMQRCVDFAGRIYLVYAVGGALLAGSLFLVVKTFFF